MTTPSPVTLDQWRMLAAVVDHGGFAQAAEHLCKSQSTVSYGVRQLQEALGLPLLTLQGRRAVLTPAGETLLRRARYLLEESDALQRLADTLARGWAPLVRLSVDVIFPQDALFSALASFAAESPDTRVEVQESVLSGGTEALLQKQADLVITGRVPPGFLGDPLMRLGFIAVAHPDHPLHRLGRPLHMEDLRPHQQVVVRDSGVRLRADSGWLGAERRLTVSHPNTSIQALCRGLGFAWIPREKIREELESGLLKPLPLVEGGTRWVELYLVLAEREAAGPAVQRLAALLGDAARQCLRADPTGTAP